MQRIAIPPSLKAVVFDLDFTLWDAGGLWCDCLDPPFSLLGGKVQDRRGRVVSLYQDVPEILDYFDDAGIDLALASRTEQPGWARELLALLGVDHRFCIQEIYPSGKKRHLSRIRERSGHAYHEILFFDDEHRNIVDCSSLGVASVHVTQGVNWNAIKDGFAMVREV